MPCSGSASRSSLIGSSEITFKHEYRDMLTGTNPNRADYQKLLSDAEAGKFSHLGLYRADRFGRDTVEGLQAATKLIGYGDQDPRGAHAQPDARNP